MAARIRRTLADASAKVRRNITGARENLNLDNAAKWVDERVGFSKTMLTPAPSYSLNPLYWLGALAVMAFGVQVLTGFLMLLYYVPTPEQAYQTTQFIIQDVPFGHILETVHLYGAYAMILLAFLHLMRGYFSSVHKRPREMMWVVGMLMGLTTLAMGLTGYLLPWTVVSKSATDVSIGMISLMPPSIGTMVKFLVAGTGSDALELTRFFDLHILVLPAVLLLLLAGKMYMFEIHGASEPVSPPKEEVKYYSWFPRVLLYLAMIGGVFLSLLIAAAILFPLNLAPEYSVTAAQNYTPQPDWYFLAVYQLLKFAIFEGNNEPIAMALVTFAAVLMTLLPFIDRSQRRNPTRRPLFSALGVIIIVELLVLTVWGYLTPGRVIPTPQAASGTLIPAFATVAAVWLLWRRKNWTNTRKGGTGLPLSGVTRMLASPLKVPLLTILFVCLLLVGSLSFASFVNSLSAIESQTMLFIVSAVTLLTTFTAMSFIVKRLVRIDQAMRRP